MNFLEVTGLITVLVLMYVYLIRPKTNALNHQVDLRISKINKLRATHPEFSKMFREFEKEQMSKSKPMMSEENYEVTYSVNGGYQDLFGRPTFVSDNSDLEKFRKSVFEKLNEFEKDNAGKKSIEDAIVKYDKIHMRQESERNKHLAQRHQNYIAYHEMLGRIFENPDVRKRKETLVEEFTLELNTGKKTAEEIFRILTNGESGLVFLDPTMKDAEYYWYSHSMIKERLQNNSNI